MFDPSNIPPENFLYGLNQTVRDPPSEFVERHEGVSVYNRARPERAARPHIAERDTAQRSACLRPNKCEALNEC